MDNRAKIYVAGHRGLVGSALVKRLRDGGYSNLVLRTSKELDLRRQADVEAFFHRNDRIMSSLPRQRSAVSWRTAPTGPSSFMTTS